MADEVDSVLADSVLLENVKSFAAGGFGGICSVLTGHPFDLMKVRMQTNFASSTVSCVKKTFAQDGLRGFYRGVIPPLIGVTPMFAVSFWGYDLGKKLVSYAYDTDPSKFSIAQISMAGFFSAIPTTAIAAPFERVKVVMQIQDAKSQKSLIGTVSQILKEGGLRSLFKGSLATVLRDGPGSALYFATYEYVKGELTKRTTGDSGELSLLAISTAGGLAGVSMWLGVFPVDTIKSQQQSSSVSKSMAQVIKEILKTKGIKGFFPGVGPALLRSFPANAATFVGVEFAKDFMNKL
ncbi:carnitine:acyl carnitine antiporter [Ascoidea rubescens DSM 1968]|uniref:Mitochondrial carrier n=1 Tax=Ascoidea rubescens DSM 1968 TaxID=1344418 RepID=A0A1D2VAQ9_9ASCO|nr:mitochondrial carrier [Ascoidea rubescens DSM 1968]ODV58681.1 mitochondrial carrier [Ascoidea rubescens DSM 1968]